MALILKTIAQDLNLSLSTVSRVLNNKSNVNEKTRQMVLDYLQAHNSMQKVAPKSSMAINDVVAVVIPDISEDYFDFVVRGIENCLWQEHIGMMLCDTMEDVEKEIQHMDMLIEKHFSGIILATIDKDEERLSSYQKRGTNLVFFDNLPNISLHYNSVITDNIKASVLAVNHLASLGHARIGFISGRQEETTGFERLVGYRRAMELNHLPVVDSQIVYGDFKEKSGYQGMNDLLDANPHLTAVFVSSAKMTYGALKALMDRNLRVPEDIALVGFDVHDATGLIRPGITTIIQNEEQIGRLCVELLLRNKQEKQAGPVSHNQRILLEPQLLIRDSCGYRAKTSGDVSHERADR
ncbi:MAG: LacI family DNA-binding transcriptional regulator [Clostridiaceae bacterium]|nr:LacI family DNA-binding transcriptional regulator [Clostridiaceae bacterium]